MTVDSRSLAMAAQLRARWFGDEGTISRPGAAVDAEGNPTNALTTVAVVDGLFVPPGGLGSRGAGSGVELIAAQAGQDTDAWWDVPPGTDVDAGDKVEVFGFTWDVTRVVVGRLTTRVVLRRTDG